MSETQNPLDHFLVPTAALNYLPSISVYIAGVSSPCTLPGPSLGGCESTMYQSQPKYFTTIHALTELTISDHKLHHPNPDPNTQILKNIKKKNKKTREFICHKQ